MVFLKSVLIFLQFLGAYRRLIGKDAVMVQHMPNTNVISMDENDCLNIYDPEEESAAEQPPLPLSDFSKNVVTYIAGFVVRKVIKSIQCMTCFDKLLSSDDADTPLLHSETSFDLLELRDRGGLIRPSNSVIGLCEKTENVIRSLNEQQLSSRSLVPQIRLRVLNDCTGLFSDDHESGLNSHSLQLSKSVIDKYIEVRLHHQASLHTERIQGRKIRSECTKKVLFSNQ